MTGRLWGIGVGPGDPELITLKGHRLLRDAATIAWFAAGGKTSNARSVVASYIRPEQRELPLIYPVTTELPAGVEYEQLLTGFYDQTADRIAEELQRGRDVAVLCEGDPLLYGSYMYLHNRLAGRFDHDVVPGVSSILAGPAALGAPLVCRNESLSILSGVLPKSDLCRRLADADAAVVMKLGRNLAKVMACVDEAGLMERAWYVERATMPAQRIMPLAEADPAVAPYFSIVVIPSATAPAR
jgi:precorrin-2/cobalt-factor-2 C20-methyltransferase